MAKRRNRYVLTNQRPAQIDRMDQSRFWRRLDELSEEEPPEARKMAVDHLKASIRKVTENAKWINAQVCRFMPQYTLHEERHFLNVLTIMDALVPDKALAQLGALDCGLLILAAYTHDLGMALSQEEYDLLQDESTEDGKRFATYRTRFDEELRQLARWRKRHDELVGKTDADWARESAEARKRIGSIEGHILASYLRDTHTEDNEVRRLRNWLDRIKVETGDRNLFCYGVGGKNYQRELALIAISHGRGAPWLRRQLIDGGPDDGFFQPVAAGESANLAFPGLLLRLADVMDFDASRTPGILFKHFGIENARSVLEWNKHSSIVGWELDIDPDGKQQPNLRYAAECEHPVHEKAIHEFKTWIDAELSAVRIELDVQRRQLPAAAKDCYDLHLPSQTRLDIRPVRDPLTDQPKYIYHDLQFQLDQHEIQQLLMGESLYGDPGLCIRELLQNALDAVDMRELRLKMKQKGEVLGPVDGERIRPGWVREPDGREEELRVTLDWGVNEETDQQWLRVTDNGIGMTEEVVKNYFTQLGKSYYRSPEFNQEQASMRATGEVVSPISNFGIGIVSCFMIADRLLVRTNPGGTNSGDNVPRDITILGAGSLFWVETGTRASQGTEILLYLKSPYRIRHDETKLQERVRYVLYPEFGNPDSMDFSGESEEPEKQVKRMEEEQDSVDPAFLACIHVVWPKHPVCVLREEHEVVRIDDQLHAKWLIPIDENSVRQTLLGWGCNRPQERFVWHFWDWTDEDHEHATGMRIRLWYVSSSSQVAFDPTGVRNIPWEVAAITEPEPEVSWGERKHRLINGMYVEQFHSLPNEDPVFARIGSRIWFDFRGAAAPSLTADRRRAFAGQKRRDWAPWLEVLDGVFRRWNSALNQNLDTAATRLGVREFEYRFDLPARHAVPFERPSPTDAFDFLNECAPWWINQPTPLALSFAFRSFLLESRPMQHVYTRDGDLLRGRDTRTFLDGPYGVNRHFYTHVLEDMRPTFSRREEAIAAIAYWHAQQDRPIGNFMHNHDFGVEFVRAFPLVDLCLQASILQEGFHPSLSKSWAPFGLTSLHGSISDSTLQSPGRVVFDRESDGRTLRFADPSGSVPAEVVERGYDISFPMTAVPLGQLRRDCDKWRTDRHTRPLGVAPFLLPNLHDLWTDPREAGINQDSFGVPHIYCLLPCFELWSKPFSHWTDGDWQDPGNLSALWDLSGQLTGTPGQVLWTRGTHNVGEVPDVGLPAPQFLDANRT